MKLSYNWIKEYVDTDASPEELAQKLTMSGSEVGSVENSAGDSIMDLEITSNRPDCLNMIGLAREVSAVFGRELKLPDMALGRADTGSKSCPVRCEVEDKKLCPRYTVRVITGTSVKPSGKWIQERISSVGLRPVNNIVDITNFCLMETGQPLHAFDLDRIKGGKIVVRRAKKGEKMITIDDVERELEPDMLVIADAERAIAIAGVMGGKDTEVSSSTKNVLIESAYFDPASIRKTSRALGLISDSSYRFERGVDKGMVRPSSDRASALITSEAGGTAGTFYDQSSIEESRREISLEAEKPGRLLGVELSAGEIKDILGRLGMGTGAVKDGRIMVTVPSFREDVRAEEDLIEEIARIYGYDRIPEGMPKFVPEITRRSDARKVAERVRRSLAASGLNEIMSYSLISAQAAGAFPAIIKSPVKLMNPLSAEQEFLTPHLVDGMLKAVVWNINRGNKDLAFFEMGKIYYRSGGKTAFGETAAVSLGLTGDISKNWKDGAKKADIYVLKGVLETMARVLRVPCDVLPATIEGFIDAGTVMLAGKEAGFIGKVDAALLPDYGLEQDVFISQIKIEDLTDKVCLTPEYSPIPRFPVSSRDISVLCDKSLPAGKIKEAIQSAGESIVAAVDITDMYEGEQIPPGKKSVTVSITYGLDSRTLTDDEIAAAHSRIKDTLAAKLGVTFR
jgi:phenylalanyl-tRNA synthetase beta chain